MSQGSAITRGNPPARRDHASKLKRLDISFLRVVTAVSRAWLIASTPVAAITADGIVNVNDLLAGIAAWGSSDDACDINGDGVVDVNDLLMIIGAWGDC